MTSTDRNYLVPAQEKLVEWVTPKISLMGAGETDGKTVPAAETKSGTMGPS